MIHVEVLEKYISCFYTWRRKTIFEYILGVGIISYLFSLKNNDSLKLKIKIYSIENTAHRLPLLFPIFHVTVEYLVGKTFCFGGNSWNDPILAILIKC